MKLISRLSALSLLLIGCGLGAGTEAMAQQVPFMFDASAYGRTNLSRSESLGNSAAMVSQQNAAFEPLHELQPSNRFRRISDAIGRIDILVERDDGRSGMMTCTGALLEGGGVLTNSHCVPTGGGLQIKAMSILMNYLKLDDEGERFKIVLPARERNTTLDYAVLTVSGNPAAKYGHVKMAVAQADPGQSLVLFHHPGGKPKMMTRFRCIAHVSQKEGAELRHRCDTEPGSSGALVFNDQLEVTGIHYLGGLDPKNDASFNTASRMSHVVGASAFLRQIAQAAGGAGSQQAVSSRPNPSATDALTAPAPIVGRPGMTTDEINKVLRSN